MCIARKPLTSFDWKLVLVPPGAVDVDIHQNREGRAHPSSFTVTRLHTLFPAYKLDRPLIVEGWRGCAHRSCIIAFDLIELNGDDLRRDLL